MKALTAGRDKVTKNGTFILPKGAELTKEELLGFIGANEQRKITDYRKNIDLYLGKHSILDEADNETGLNNKLVVALPKYIVDVYNGYFSGNEPKITLSEKSANDVLNNWNNQEHVFDKLNEISKQTDIFGRSIVFVYQGEDSQPHISFSSPEHAFIVYDDTVSRAPLVFVRYSIDDGQPFTQAYGQLQYADRLYTFKDGVISADKDSNAYGINPYGMVPAVEFYENEERQGVLDPVKTLIDELDRAVSQKANQVEYFDNAYMYLLGVRLPKDDKTGEPIFNFTKQRVLYSPNADPNAKVGFIAKPDADNIQENLINRLTNLIFQTAMVPNLQDEAFSGNASGVALQYKLLPMKNKADSKERKFKTALSDMYAIVFKTLFSNSTAQDNYKDLTYQFVRNIPTDIANTIAAAKDAEGIVSKKTQLSLLPFVSDVSAEQEQIDKEREDGIKAAQSAVTDLPDFMKDPQQDNNQSEE